ncbi:hypothetical protein DENIS_2987 [Desulfonema ishimotonii]|uniref:Uncharacterized protein n=1 Tax=Desulfonema ishimotonii TaxID=45657 RepID=A0A401FW17_9BACT|nr:hypothetical protein [Desulfonema ishimotonii]GBC59977.1 hypothetical protein DENIS_0919 [Desulfonema ishimotonii]GBC60337.1 hypothetical protein DENIS_1288 [Desulfonema ishimotonii]GBC60999.1 hypothetical protein DENIS_1959 [Desulfonema ishimotonii]GBC61155.1 hypothetical protein DENIS_2115 [Desulfonema ishimotonii]GBC62024.1 hypothetical protein DENIS_2987 [Desulfonema ishimotonii]
MATIELTIRDDEGNIILSSHKRIYELNIGKGDSDTIEGAVEQFRHKALKDIHKDLLSNSQEEFVARIKKKDSPATAKHR